jgi:predicted nuclease of restriction endonuclease-like (RecB) superfamily
MRKKPLYERIRQILESARIGAARTVNTTQVVANWLVGREIVEEEQQGRRKAEYGRKLTEELSAKLQKDFGAGYSATNLKLFRQFYLCYPDLHNKRIGHTLRDESSSADEESGFTVISSPIAISHTKCDQSWKPGLLHPNLSWSLYRHLIRVESSQARAFYEIEAIKNNNI